MEFRRGSFRFGSSKGKEQIASQTLSFSTRINRVAIGITGYSVSYDKEKDHHLGYLSVRVYAGVDGNDPTKVVVTGILGLRDWSGEFDDHFSGNIQWVVIADPVPVTAPSPGDPRGDLVIRDAEITQAIQHFRSARHLDAKNVYPDNSIRMVAGKLTAVRLYIDYDPDSGLTNIAQISGEMEVIGKHMNMAITPNTSIVTGRDYNIDRGNSGHTLNFIIPEYICWGVVKIRARVFDVADNTQFSANFERTINFEKFPELPIIAVSIDYTGKDIISGAQLDALRMPQILDFIDVFQFTEKVYPIPETTISSYNTMSYDKDIKSDINAGNCDKFADLLDAIDDFKGDSDDIVYGLINTGIDTGSVSGCGRPGVAAGKKGYQETAAHELGHALGRKHAPCDNVTRCAEPARTDDNYPVYSGFDSDSIGEYGFDIYNSWQTVYSPGEYHDFMGYSWNEWVSPYTYKALMSKIPSTYSEEASALKRGLGLSHNSDRLGRSEWIPVKTPYLFLRIDIDHNHEVHFYEAFHFDCRPRQYDIYKTDFLVKFFDESGKVLNETCLYADSACSCCGNFKFKYPVKIRQAVSYPKGACILVVYDCDKEIYRKEIPAAPKVTVQCKGNENQNDAHLLVKWKSDAETEKSEFNLWALVQWQDAHGTWRGCAPRTRNKEIRIPKRIFGRQKMITLRVLVTSGIATGVGVWQGTYKYTSPTGSTHPDIKIRLAGVGGQENNTVVLPSIIRAVAIADECRTLPSAEIIWYGEDGAEISRGKRFDLRNLPYGETRLTASMLESGHGSGSEHWLIERGKNDEFRVLRGTIERKDPC